MGRVVAIGARARVAGLSLAGVSVLVAEDPEAVRQAWRSVSDEVTLVIVTPAVAEVLGRTQLQGTRPLIAVMPA
ncbi:V-type ATP synthase subunit F [Streptomyces sp. NPDC018000]|uniref:V-type ATP synthase subunit F n=1 Tax=Streptomyces sp. NPDC018000 TaxID=3365028 RepID=UPI0037BB0BC5